MLDEIFNATPLKSAATAVVVLLLKVVSVSPPSLLSRCLSLSLRVVASGGYLELLGGFVARLVLVLVEGWEERPILATHSIRILEKYSLLARIKAKNAQV